VDQPDLYRHFCKPFYQADAVKAGCEKEIVNDQDLNISSSQGLSKTTLRTVAAFKASIISTRKSVRTIITAFGYLFRNHFEAQGRL
jgi:hypothetical protein